MSFDNNNRLKYISLFFAGGSPEVAYSNNPAFTVDEYEQLLGSKEYREFAAQIEGQFLNNIESVLIGNLYKLQLTLNSLDPKDRNFPAIYKNYTELLKLTAPIVERLNKQRVEFEQLQGLELAIKGADD